MFVEGAVEAQLGMPINHSYTATASTVFAYRLAPLSEELQFSPNHQHLIADLEQPEERFDQR